MITIKVVGGHLSGDADALINHLKAKLMVSHMQATRLLSDACERLELACDSDEELAQVTLEDIVNTARDILK